MDKDMGAKTDIKFFVHTNNNAPQLQNAFGSMINVLDAVLVNGIQVGTVSSLTASGKIVTAIFGTAHNLMSYQVIKIVGANQAEYNVEARILTVPNATTITFELAAVPSTTIATGTIHASLPPLDWDKPFSSVTALGGGRAAYRSKNELLSNRPFLRIIDERVSSYNNNFSKYAKVGIVESMTGIDAMSGVQAPYISSATTRNWNPTGSGDSVKNGWAKWYYCSLGEYYADNTDLSGQSVELSQWLIVGDKSGFYVMNSMNNNGYISEEERKYSYCYGFGAFNPISNDDLFNHYLLATNIWESASSIVYKGEYHSSSVVIGSENPDYNAPGKSVFLQRGYKKSVFAPATCRKATLEGGVVVTGSTAGYSLDSAGFGGVLLQSPLIMEVTSDSKFLPRGFLPIIKTIPHKANYENLQLIEEDGHIYIAKDVYGTTGSPRGIVLFDLGGI